MRSSTHASPDDIDITSVWSSLKTSLPKILVASLVAGALTYAVLALMAPRYASEAQLEIAAKGSLPDPSRDPRRESSAESVTVRMDKEAINTHVRALLSPDLAQKIIADLKLDQKPEFNSAKGSPDMLSGLLRLVGIGAPQKRESDLDRALAAYFKQIEVYAPKESRTIVVKFTSIDPALASTVANRIAEVYRGELSSQIVVESDKAFKDLEPQIEALRQDIAAAEAAVERQRATADVFKSGSSSSNTNEQQIAELTAEVSRAKAMRSEAEARARSAREMTRAGTADALPDVQKSPLMQSLVQQRVRLQRTIAEVSASLLPGHPRMKQLSAELAGLNKQIASEVSKVVDSLEREAKIAALTEEAKTRSLNEMKSRVVTTAPDEVKLRNLEATAKSKRDELTNLEAKYEAAKQIAASQVVPVEAKIVTEARASSVVVYPKKTSTALIAALAVFLFGTALSMTRALLRGAREPGLPPRPLEMPPLRAVKSEPTLVPRTVPVPAERVARERPGRASSITTVADQLQSRAPGSGGCRTLMVGENAGMDAGPEALQLGDELARRGHATIVIDWSPDGAGFAQKVGLSRTPGFSELLSGTARFEDVVQRLPKSEAHVIASGAAQPYSTEGPDLNQLNLVLDALDDAYDHIIVVGAYEAARMLFEDVEGRFDAGITVSDGNRRVTVIQDPPGTFLGYEVADIELIRFERKDGASTSTQRGSRPAQDASSEAHPA